MLGIRYPALRGVCLKAQFPIGLSRGRRCPPSAIRLSRRRSTSPTRASTPLPASGVRGAVHIQMVNSRHSRIGDFLRARRGIAAKHLDSYLRWFHLIALGDQPLPRACLEAAMAKPCLRFAN